MIRSAALVALLALAPAARADTPDPLRFVSAKAGFFLKVERPRALAEVVTGLDAVRAAPTLGPVRDVLDGPVVRRGLQLLGFVERELGAKWPELLDQLAGGGAVVAGTLGEGNQPALLVVQGTEEVAVRKGFDLLIRALDDELARQGSKEKVGRGTQAGVDTARLGKDFFAARVGAALLISNRAEVLASALAQPTDRAGSLAVKPSVAAARGALPADPLAWVWVDFAAVRSAQATRDFLDSTRNDFLFQMVLGGTMASLRQSDFVAAGLHREGRGLRFAVRLPGGRGGFPDGYALHTPAAGGPGSLPLLEPPGVVYSQSFYLDFGHAWAKRGDLFTAEMVGQLDKANADLSKLLPGSAKFGELLEAWGPHHRLVVVNRPTQPYKTTPGQALPGFGYVASARDPRFLTGVPATIRAAGLVASLQLGLKMTETTHDGVKIVGWRFPENKALDGDPDGLRFNFEPCFAVVGDSLVVASTVDVCKALIPEVKRTATLPGGAAVWRGKGYAAGAADALAAVPEPFITDAVLRNGVGLADARKQVDALTAWVRGLGTARAELDIGRDVYRADVIWEPK
ncbi:hypothetical protein [Urbifossiella limnaea]|uniref:DUF3352 domain-containing protein n=1 Tax=Urbifossiella limnaea TaxID=2528023 RepID=A0A517XRJ2_9BACT|nr:hypothetical protein [Urbifossiella limnaea]QDU20131.1 hypothetical protein ETAA1_20740 [Urbifossiella limnaea]